jgi:DNA-directed RNA polymerase subunit RPC12/RpoP
MESSVNSAQDMPDYRTLMQEAEHPVTLDYVCEHCHHDFSAPNNGYSVMCPVCQSAAHVIPRQILDPHTDSGHFRSDEDRERRHGR